MYSNNRLPDGTKITSLDEMSRLIHASPAGPYGFIVSQKCYDALRTQVPEKFEGGNSFGSVPIVIDPDLEDTEMDVAFTKKGWRDRLKQIEERRCK